MSHLFRSAGLAPVAGTIDWLTRARRETRFSAGLGPVESTIRSACGEEQSKSCARPGQARHGATCSAGIVLFSLSMIARRGQAPDVAEQSHHC
jgi:hypothetical protein